MWMPCGSRSCWRRRAARCEMATCGPRGARVGRGAVAGAGARADAVAAALALWRGSALQGLTGTTWFDAEARRLETLRVDALEEQFEVALALGEHREPGAALRPAG